MWTTNHVMTQNPKSEWTLHQIVTHSKLVLGRQIFLKNIIWMNFLVKYHHVLGHKFGKHISLFLRNTIYTDSFKNYQN